MTPSRSSFTFDLVVPGDPAVVWERLWDLDRHTSTIPLTTVRGGPLSLATTFVGRTALGPVGFDDVMVVREWDPPQRVVIDKVGRLLRGSIEVTLEPRDQATLVRWSQSYGASGVPDALTRLTRPAVRAAYRHVVRRLTRA